jgi:hypothetical protein
MQKYDEGKFIQHVISLGKNFRTLLSISGTGIISCQLLYVICNFVLGSMSEVCMK